MNQQLALGRQHHCSFVKKGRALLGLLALALLLGAAGRTAWAGPELLLGRYQLAGQPVFCELHQVSEGVWQLSLWQGASPEGPTPGGLALGARLLAESEDPLRGGQPRDMLYTSRADQLPGLREQGYLSERLVAHLAPEPEPTPSPPLTYNWQSVWGGDGWGRLFLLTRGQDFYMFWYYGQAEGPRYFGRLQLAADGRTAQGLAVGQPEPLATYYRLELYFDLDAPQGPRLRQESWRLAAPLDDGRLVSFVKPQLNESLLMKTGQALPAEELAILERTIADPAGDPQAQFKAALEQAKRQNRLLER